jgi:hypothetical protein
LWHQRNNLCVLWMSVSCYAALIEVVHQQSDRCPKCIEATAEAASAAAATGQMVAQIGNWTRRLVDVAEGIGGDRGSDVAVVARRRN